jgi:hypothetical protein
MSDLERPSIQRVKDLNELPVLKEGLNITDKLMTKSEAEAFQAGSLHREPVRAHIRPIEGQELAQAVAQPQRIEPTGTAPPPAAALPPQPTAALVTQHELPPPPVQPQDSQPVQKRINQLYGQMKSAQEERDQYADHAARLESRIAQLEHTAVPAAPTYEIEQPQFGPGTPATPAPAGEYLSRGEFKQTMSELVQAIGRQNQLADSQRASRAEAERDFAQYFQNPDFATAYESALTQDFAGDPNGPVKAAALARGLLADYHTPATAQEASADAAKRQALTGIGPTVAEGNTPAPTDQASRYHAALARAQATGKDADFATALSIKYGQA